MSARSMASAGAKVIGVDIEPASDWSTDDTFVRRVGDYLVVSPELGEFDVVVALDAVEHFPSDRDVMESIYANTRQGGFTVITVPAYRWLWSSHDAQNHHYRRYTRRTLQSALESAGFDVERVGYLFAGLTLPKAAVVILERITRRPVRIGNTPPGFVNHVATAYFRIEAELAMRLRNFLPIGTSVAAVARRPSSQMVHGQRPKP